MVSEFLRKESKKDIQDLATPDELLECGLSVTTVKKRTYYDFILSDEKIDCLIMLMVKDEKRAKKVKAIIWSDLEMFKKQFEELFSA